MKGGAGHFVISGTTGVYFAGRAWQFTTAAAGGLAVAAAAYWYGGGADDDRRGRQAARDGRSLITTESPERG